MGVAANGASTGWRGAPLLASGDGGASFAAIGATALPATIGRTLSALAPGSVEIADRVNTIDVELLNAAMTLADADAAALAGGANLAMIGGEAVQFGRAVPIGGRRWRLSDLWRGRRGTEDAVGGHGADEPFVLIEAETLTRLPDTLAVTGVRVRATGIGDGADGTEVWLGSAGRAAMPLSPRHLTARRRADGSTDIAWIRRSREGWRWRDGIDVPVGEEREAYRIERTGPGLAPLIAETGVPGWTYSDAQRTADAAAGATQVTIAVAQIGSRGLSPAAAITIGLI